MNNDRLKELEYVLSDPTIMDQKTRMYHSLNPDPNRMAC
jgi:hypothetical protein